MCDNNAKLIHPLCVLIEMSCLMLVDTIMQNKFPSLIDEIQVAMIGASGSLWILYYGKRCIRYSDVAEHSLTSNPGPLLSAIVILMCQKNGEKKHR